MRFCCEVSGVLAVSCLNCPTSGRIRIRHTKRRFCLFLELHVRFHSLCASARLAPRQYNSSLEALYVKRACKASILCVFCCRLLLIPSLETSALFAGAGAASVRLSNRLIGWRGTAVMARKLTSESALGQSSCNRETESEWRPVRASTGHSAQQQPLRASALLFAACLFVETDQRGVHGRRAARIRFDGDRMASRRRDESAEQQGQL